MFSWCELVTNFHMCTTSFSTSTAVISQWLPISNIQPRINVIRLLSMYIRSHYSLALTMSRI